MSASSEEIELAIADCQPILRGMVNRYSRGLPAHTDSQDLYSAAVIGLIDALDKFRPGESPFKSYARIRVRGEILSEMERLSWDRYAMKLKKRRIRRVKHELTRQLCREPEGQEIADGLGLTIAEYDDMILTIHSHMENFCDVDNAENLSGFVEPDRAECNEHRKNLKRLVALLPDMERHIMMLYYFGTDQTMREIGESIGVSESRVCQIHTNAITRLREDMSLWVESNTTEYLCA